MSSGWGSDQWMDGFINAISLQHSTGGSCRAKPLTKPVKGRAAQSTYTVHAWCRFYRETNVGIVHKHMTWALIVKSLYCLSEHCCINVFRMSWVRVRFSGTMAWVTHACTLPPSISLFLPTTRAHTVQSAHFWSSYFLLSILFESVTVLLTVTCSALLFTWHPFKINVPQVTLSLETMSKL